MAKSLTIKNKNNLILYPKTVSSLVYNNNTGNTVKLDLDNLIGQVAELQGVENAFFGGIVEASTDIATDYSNKGYSGTYLYMVGTNMTSLVAYQYTGSGSPTQLFGGATYDFTDYSEVKQEVAALGPKVNKVKIAFNAIYNVLMSATYKDDVTNMMSVLRTAIDQFDDIPLTAIAISGEDVVSGAAGITSKYTANYTPANTTQTNVRWSITSGGSYATIDAETGVLTVLGGASSNNVTIRATSADNNSIYAEKTIVVTGLTYTELTYINVDDGVYIDTGIKPHTGLTFYAKVARTENIRGNILGCTTGSKPQEYVVTFSASGTNSHMSAYIAGGSAKSNYCNTSTIYTMQSALGSPYVSFSNGKLSNNLTTSTVISDVNIYLFALNGETGNSSAKIYNVKFYDEGVLFADFIPVLVGSTPKMLNNVTKELFDFTGSGNINYE